VLAQYIGKYRAPNNGVLEVTRDNNSLVLIVGGDKKFLLHPESQNVFYVADRDLTFDFVKEGAKVSKIIVREHEAVVEEARPE
jgi:hypothetical protein